MRNRTHPLTLAALAALMGLAGPVLSADFRPVVWQLTQPDGREVSLHDLKLDGQGRAWVSWRSNHSVFLKAVGDNGQSGPPLRLIEPVERPEHRWYFLGMAIDPGGRLWCARMEDREQMSSRRDSAPPVDLFRANGPEVELVRSLGFDKVVHPFLFGFIGQEPFLFVEYRPYSVHWEIHWLEARTAWSFLVTDGLTWPSAITRVGASLAIFTRTDYWLAGCGGCYSRHLDVLTVDPVNKQSRWFPFPTVVGHEEGSYDNPSLVLSSYMRIFSMGSDDSGRIFVVFEQDDSPSPIIRAMEAASGDSLNEWTLGYTSGYFLANMTSNHSSPGLVTHRQGNLDLWVLEEQSWHGPYPIATGASAAAEIAVDDQGRYWLAWDDGTALYGTVVSPADLGLPTAVTSLPAATPSAPTLGQNFPNPFNAQTTIRLQVPKQADLRIFNLHGQLLRSMPVPRGSSRITWDGTDSEGLEVGSGIYLYRLRVDGRTSPFRRMTLVR